MSTDSKNAMKMLPRRNMRWKKRGTVYSSVVGLRHGIQHEKGQKNRSLRTDQREVEELEKSLVYKIKLDLLNSSRIIPPIAGRRRDMSSLLDMYSISNIKSIKNHL